MSRRKAFETSLSGGKATVPQSQSAKGKGKASATSTTPDSDNAVVAQRQAATGPTTVAPAAELDDASQCFICAEPITYWAVGQCNHRVCQ